jgi:hypothetical protein
VTLMAIDNNCERLRYIGVPSRQVLCRQGIKEMIARRTNWDMARDRFEPLSEAITLTDLHLIHWVVRQGLKNCDKF